MSDNLPVIAIIGRPNVGKSALFNAIMRRKVSIVHEQSGVTRDPVALPCEHFGHHFLLIDTGGLGTLNRERQVDLFDGMIREQVEKVVAEADAIIWVVNCQDGVTVMDEEVRDFLHRAGKPVVICANKADNMTLAQAALIDFARLGFDAIEPTSCTHSQGVGQLLDAVVKQIPRTAPKTTEETRLRVAVVGKPNVGKSSLVNRIFGSERVMVSEIAGTTRDAIDIPITLTQDGVQLPLTLVDTAGMRRKKQIDTVVEFFSANRTEQAIRKSDMILFLVDSNEPCSTQDSRIARLIVDAGKPCIILANKWDLASATGQKAKDYIATLRHDLPFMQHAPVHLISALSGYNFPGIFTILQRVREQMRVMIPTAVFNQFLEDILLRNPPNSTGTRRFKVFYGTMTHTPPPKFVLFVNSKKLCPTNYLQYLENQIREAFFQEAGMPVFLELRERLRLANAPGTRRAAAGAQHQRQAQGRDLKRRIQRSKR